MDRGGGRASGRGRSRAPPFPQRDQGPPPSPMQGSTSRGHRRKSSREREAVYKSIWGDSDDEEKEKDAGKAETTDVKEEKESKPVEKDEKPVEKETQQLTKELEKVKISPPAPPATVVPPPAVITGADWSELTDDEDLAFLEDVPVPVTAPASVHEDDTDDTPGPSNHTGLDVTTANDIDHSVRRGSPRVNVGRQTSDKEGVDVKLAEQIPVRPVNPEQAQTTSDIGSEGESTTSVGDAGHAQTANAVNNVNPQAAPLQNSRWASAPRGQGHRGVSLLCCRRSITDFPSGKRWPPAQQLSAWSFPAEQPTQQLSAQQLPASAAQSTAAEFPATGRTSSESQSRT
jgi:hypothetical protein